MNGNWATVYLSQGLGASATMASVGLTAFWGTVTGGRILFALIEKYCPPRFTFRLLPILLAGFFLALALTPKSYPVLGVISFGMTGLGCSALLPLVISFAQKELTALSASVAGGLIGFYQMGYGVAAFGVGSLQDSLKLPFAAIYAGAIPCALALALIAYFLVAGAEKATSA
jgi:predicted MFS family arabinose efflux permease